MLVRAIMVIACDAANAQRLPSRPSIPIHVAEVSAVTKLLQVRVTENVSVPHDAYTGQLAHPVLVKFRSLHSNFTGGHIGLWQKNGGNELSLAKGAEVNRANYGRNVYHHSMGASVARVFNQRSNNPLHVRTIRLVSVVNEAKTSGVDIGSIANSHSLIGSDPLLAGEECSAASCKKRAKQKPKHWIADSTFFRGGVFLGHVLLPSISENASGSSRRVGTRSALTECRLWFR
jgi:hypothetical protein